MGSPRLPSREEDLWLRGGKMGNASLTAIMPDTALLWVFVVGHCDIRLEAGEVNCEERFFRVPG